MGYLYMFGLLLTFFCGYRVGHRDLAEKKLRLWSRRKSWPAIIPRHPSARAEGHYRESPKSPFIKPEIERFARDMEFELEANDYKGDWRKVAPESCAYEMEEHATKLREAVEEQDYARIRELSADCAVIGMMMTYNSSAINAERRKTPYPYDDWHYARAMTAGASVAFLRHLSGARARRKERLAIKKTLVTYGS